MIPVSREFREKMTHNTNFREQAEITLANGTELVLSESDFTLKNNNVSEGAGLSGLPLGIAVCRAIQIEIKNDDDRFSDYDFFGARIHLYLTYQLSQSVEKIDYGIYTVTIPETYGSTVIITAFDDMYKADKPYDTSLVFPTTIGNVLHDACINCGINQGDLTFTNSNFVVNEKPNAKDNTYRSVIGNIAMIAGGNARMDMQGYLRIKTYSFNVAGGFANLDGGNFEYNLGDVADGGNFTDYTSGDSYDGGHFTDIDYVVLNSWKNLKIETDDVVITGVKDKETGYTRGVAGYVIEVKNPLYKGSVETAIGLIGDLMIGARFRPFFGDCVANPIVEFMDDVILHDRKGNTYRSVVTDVNFVFLGFTTLKNSAESAVRNSSVYYSEATEAIIESRKLVEAEKTARETAMAQMAQVIANSSGLYMTEEEQPDESIIYYMHNKPELSESNIIWRLSADAFAISTDGGETYPYGIDVNGTAILNRIYAEGINANYITGGILRLGGQNNVNGQIYIYDSQGRVCGKIDNTGISIWSPTNQMQVIMNPEIGFVQRDASGHDYYGLTYVEYPDILPIEPYKYEYTYEVHDSELYYRVIDRRYDSSYGITTIYEKRQYQYQKVNGRSYWSINAGRSRIPTGVSHMSIELPSTFEGKNISISVTNEGIDWDKATSSNAMQRKAIYDTSVPNERADGTTWTDSNWVMISNSLISYDAKPLNQWNRAYSYDYNYSSATRTNALNYTGSAPITDMPAIPDPNPNYASLGATSEQIRQVIGELDPESVSIEYEYNAEDNTIELDVEANTINMVSVNELMKIRIVAVC